MASGRKNYFRHSFFAGNDDKIVDLIAKNGKAAYFHYFRLLELCGEQSSESVPEKFVFHRRTLCAELMVTNSKLSHHLLAIQSSLLCEVVLDDRKVELYIPNISKYLGKYSTKKEPNTPNKRKEKKKKEKESKKEIASGFSEEILNLWNENCTDMGMPKVKTLSAVRMKKLQKAIKDFGELSDWRKIFNVASTKGFVGKDDREFIPNWDYIFRNENYVKFFEEYDVIFAEEKKSSEQIENEVVAHLINQVM